MCVPHVTKFLLCLKEELNILNPNILSNWKVILGHHFLFLRHLDLLLLFRTIPSLILLLLEFGRVNVLLSMRQRAVRGAGSVVGEGCQQGNRGQGGNCLVGWCK